MNFHRYLDGNFIHFIRHCREMALALIFNVSADQRTPPLRKDFCNLM